jgi:hypothetical protein
MDLLLRPMCSIVTGFAKKVAIPMLSARQPIKASITRLNGTVKAATRKPMPTISATTPNKRAKRLINIRYARVSVIHFLHQTAYDPVPSSMSGRFRASDRHQSSNGLSELWASESRRKREKTSNPGAANHDRPSEQGVTTLMTPRGTQPARSNAELNKVGYTNFAELG